MGLVNLLPGRVVQAAADDGRISVAGGHPIRVGLSGGMTDGAGVQVAIRPESLRLADDGADDPEATAGILCGKVADCTFLGNLIDCQVVLDDGTRVRVQADPSASLQVGQAIRLAFDAQACTVFPA
jgi:ABC-type Fe3+/spermidine/putrescine transport system ATPase subunit